MSRQFWTHLAKHFSDLDHEAVMAQYRHHRGALFVDYFYQLEAGDGHCWGRCCVGAVHQVVHGVLPWIVVSWWDGCLRKSSLL